MFLKNGLISAAGSSTGASALAAGSKGDADESEVTRLQGNIFLLALCQPPCPTKPGDHRIVFLMNISE